MAAAPADNSLPVIFGRSSSHFTRVVRIFAAEMGVVHSFQVVRNLMSSDAQDYGGNPALKMPTLQTPRGLWFGALNISRELTRLSGLGRRVVWPEDLTQAIAASAQELVLGAMATEVALIMGKAVGSGAGGPHEAKMRTSLLSTLVWLEDNAAAALATLPPERDLSTLEVTLFCLVTHLGFRAVLPTDGYVQLNEFVERFAQRASAAATAYHFDS